LSLQAHTEAQALIWQRAREMAAEKGLPPPTTEQPDMLRRLDMGVLPAGARLIPNPYNRIAGFSLGRVHFVPGFPVMAHPMMAWVLETEYGLLPRPKAVRERSVVLQGVFEAQLSPLMETVEASFVGIKVFSLPSEDHPTWGKCVELGVKAGLDDAQRQAAFEALKEGLPQCGARICTELVR
jgi:molybdopterin-biosynthesis enzyme MoeA-like protein